MSKWECRENIQKGLLIVISGPSGAGKGTVCKALLKEVPKLKLSISTTTRKPRPREIDGINYNFIEKEEFKEMVQRNAFLEYAMVYNNYYGTPKDKVMNELQMGKDVILEIDIQGALKVKSEFPEGVFIFVMPPSMEELKNRITKRGTETKEELTKRFQASYEEINYVSKYNYIVINDEIDDAVEKIKSILIAEKCRVDRLKDSIDKIVRRKI
ncbi:guanylate kinase [Irregularibacter muris]|uniref:Guanylate kinase n=1 Tax=Irregularibacter muris TaxID=1796619 RepID=A0AAE3HES8_9FIRM|nr:guanylate kinase [Irregularibacter muris]MCR1898177.1 guanylate kinase [Irregularibacter muris]